MKPTILLVRHARSIPPTPNGPDEYQRGSTETGKAQADRLADSLTDLEPGMVISSPYRRAIRTLEPAARQWNLPIHIDPRFREWDSGLEPVPDYARHYAQSWDHPQCSRPGAESLHELTERAIHALSDIVAGLRERPAVIGSHGTFIARVLLGLTCPGICWAFHRAMPMPAVYRLEFGGPSVHVIGPGL